MDTLKITRYIPEVAQELEEISNDFFEHLPGNELVAIYAIEPKENVLLYISEYSNGTFWTVGVEDFLGTLSQCIDFLLHFFEYEQ